MKKIKILVCFVFGLLVFCLGGNTNLKAEETNELISAEVIDYDSQTRSVDLVWAGLEGAASYKICLWSGDVWIECEISQNSIILPAYDEIYTYKVVGMAENGEVLGQSQELNLSIPSEVSSISTTALSQKMVKLAWEKSKSATSYLIYKKKGKGEYSFESEVEDTECRISVEKDKKYTFKIVAVYNNGIDSLEGEEATYKFNNSTFVSIDHQKYTYKEMKGDIKELCKKYSDYVSYESIGTTKNKRKIYDVVLGNPDAKKSLLVVCAIHAREYVTTVVAMKQLEYYLINYNNTVDGSKLSEVFEECNVHYIMMTNPDGVTISQTKKSTWKNNANGVNLNRNFPYNFKIKGSVKSNDYTGKSEASEKETKAIINITKELSKQDKFAVLNYHAMGQIVFGDYSGKNSYVKKTTKKMYSVARKTTGYGDASSYNGGNESGNYRDYVLYKIKAPCITVEVGSVACPISSSYYNSIYEKNKLLTLREAKCL